MRTLSELFQLGFDSGQAAAENCVVDLDHFEDAEDDPQYAMAKIAEAYTAAAVESECGSRDYTPFEHLAYELNTMEEYESEEAWEFYDQGVSSGIAAGVADRIKLRYDIHGRERDVKVSEGDLEKTIHAILVEAGNIPGVISLKAKVGGHRVIEVTYTGSVCANSVFDHLNGYPDRHPPRGRCFCPVDWDLTVMKIAT